MRKMPPNTMIIYDHIEKARPAEVLTVERIKEQAMKYFNGNVRRVLYMVKVAVVCRGAKDAAGFCRKLRQHPQVTFQ